jgi:hypothetical protein
MSKFKEVGARIKSLGHFRERLDSYGAQSYDSHQDYHDGPDVEQGPPSSYDEFESQRTFMNEKKNENRKKPAPRPSARPPTSQSTNTSFSVANSPSFAQPQPPWSPGSTTSSQYTSSSHGPPPHMNAPYHPPGIPASQNTFDNQTYGAPQGQAAHYYGSTQGLPPSTPSAFVPPQGQPGYQQQAYNLPQASYPMMPPQQPMGYCFHGQLVYLQYE